MHKNIMVTKQEHITDKTNTRQEQYTQRVIIKKEEKQTKKFIIIISITIIIIIIPALMALPSTTLDSKMFYKRQETTPTPIPIT